jgi:hypothetical protein
MGSDYSDGAGGWVWYIRGDHTTEQNTDSRLTAILINFEQIELLFWCFQNKNNPQNREDS